MPYGNVAFDTITTSGNLSITGNVSVTGNVSTSSNLTTSGTLAVTGNTTVSNLTASGALVSSGTLAVTGNTTVSNLTASGVMSVTGNLTVTSNISVSNSITISGNSTISGSGTANSFILVSKSLGTASAGTMEYDGIAPYFTPLGTQRGVIPGMQFFRLNSALAGSNVNSPQSFFGVGVTLSASTIYRFESVITMYKTAGATSHTIATLFGGTATLNNIHYTSIGGGSTAVSAPVNGFDASGDSGFANVATAVVMTAAIASANSTYAFTQKGTVSINAGGTFIPQYQLSAAPGGAYSVVAGSHFLIYPIGASGANVSIGTWA